MIRAGFSVLFALLSVTASIRSEPTLGISASDGTDGLRELTSVHQNNEKEAKEERDEKLEDEIYKIGEAMHAPESSVLQENSELRINDAMDLKKRLDGFKISKFTLSTTERPKLVEEPTSIDEEVLEPGEEGEQLRQPSEKELADLSERLKGREEEKRMFYTQMPVIARGHKNEIRLIEDSNIEQLSREETKKDITSAILVDEDFRRKEAKEREKEAEGEMISWDLIQFLIMLTPVEQTEITWWTMVLEAVKCSLRSCPNTSSTYWDNEVFLPRITRHRRQDSTAETTPTSKPCACQNLERYFEELYESIGKQKKTNNETSKT